METYIEQFDQQLKEMRSNGMSGIAFFVDGSDDVSTEDLACEGLLHLRAARDAVENGNYRLATDIDF